MSIRNSALERSNYQDRLCNDKLVGPLALSVMMLTVQRSALYEWPTLAASDGWVSARLQITKEAVRRVLDAVTALGYLEPTGKHDKAGRQVYRACMPPARPRAESPESNTSEATKEALPRTRSRAA